MFVKEVKIKLELETLQSNPMKKIMDNSEGFEEVLFRKKVGVHVKRCLPALLITKCS